MPNGHYFNKQLALWEEQSKFYWERIQRDQTRIEDISRQISEASMPEVTGAKISKGIPSWILPKWEVEALTRGVAPVLIEELKPQLEQATRDMERDEFYYRMFNELPIAISQGLVASSDEALSSLPQSLVNSLIPSQLRAAKIVMDEMIQTITGTRPLPEMAKDMPELELPELVPPVEVEGARAAPVTLMGLTTQEIIKALQTPATPIPPSPILSEEEWQEYLRASGYDPDDPEADYLASQAEQLITDWQERDNQLIAFREGVAEIPDYTLADMMKNLIAQPGLALMDVAQIYFENVSMPLAGLLYKTFIPDLEAKYQEYRKTESTWRALANAWEEWDSPGEGAWEWILKYMIMEGITDPITYIGWGLATKITKPLGGFGRLVGAAERGAASVLDIPFDMIKAGLRKLPKSLSQRAALQQAKAIQYVDKWVTEYTGKGIRDLGRAPDGMVQFNRAIERAIRAASLFPQADSDIVRAGRELLKHIPMDERVIIDWSNRLAEITAKPGLLTKEVVTRELVDNIDNLFEDYFTRGATGRQSLTLGEAGRELLTRLNIENSDDAWKLAQRILDDRANRIVQDALVIGQARSPANAIYSLGKRNFRNYIKTEESIAYLARKQMGTFGSILQNVEARAVQVWRNSLDRWVVRPFAEAYLAFALYGPMNIVEDIFRSALGGVWPNRVNVVRFSRKWIGVSYDPNLMRDAWSETLGELRRAPEAAQTNWILSLGGLAKGFGEKTYGVLVEKPGRVGIDFRRGFVDGRATQILKDLGGDTFDRLVKIDAPRPRLSNNKLAKEVYETINDLKLSANPDSIRYAKELYTREAITRREVNNILIEHPDMPRAVRDKLIKDMDDNVLVNNPEQIGIRMDESRSMLLDDFIRSPERAEEQFKQLADFLTDLEVRNPEEMARVMSSLNYMAQIQGAVPKQVMKRVTQRSRGLPFAERSATINADMDRLSLFLERSKDDMQRVADKIKTELIPEKPRPLPEEPEALAERLLAQKRLEELGKVPPETVFTPELTRAYTRYYDTLMSKSINASDNRMKDIARRRDYFAGATKENLKDTDFWEQFYLETDAFWERFDLEQLEFDDLLNSVAKEMGQIQGVKYPTRPPVRVTGRALAPQDIATVLNVRMDDVTKSLMESMMLRQDKARFTRYVMHHVGPDDVGFTPESVGEVYDQILWSLQTDPRTVDWMTPRLKELEDIKNQLHQLYNSKLLPDEEITEIGRYVDDIANQVEGLVYEPIRVPAKPKAAVPPAKIPKRVPTSEFKDYNDLRQQAMDEAHKWYYKEFTDYTNANAFDAVMKVIYPYWCTPEDTKILTRTGWKHHSQLAIGEDVLVVDPERLVTRWEPLQDIAVFDYDEDLMVIPAKGKDIKFTPNHRWLTINKSGYTSIKRGYQLTDYDMIPRALPHEFPATSVLSPRDAAILGWTCTDGYIKKPNGHKPAMVIYQHLGKYLLEIQSLCGVRGKPRQPTGYTPVDDWCNFTVNVRQEDSDRILSICPDWSYLPELVSKLSKESAESMFGAMFMAEGSTTGLDSCWKQNPGPVSEAFQLLSVLLGKAVSVNSDRINFLRNNKPYHAKEARRMRTEHYSGKVWCPITPSGTWFADFNGSVLPTGNTYESQRWFWVPRSFIRHPGVFTTFERWQNNSDYGYIHIPGTAMDINPFRGTVFGTLTTRLARRDFPEYYDSLGIAGDFVEFNDFLSRYGFYPGAHIGVPLAVFGGVEMQFGEIMPAIPKTGLDFLIATFPDSEPVRFISDHIFGDRFRNYLTILQVNRRGGDGTIIFSKVEENRPLTDEEQQLWDEARREVGWYSAGFEQFAMFRMRTDEQYKMYEESAKVIEQMTGYTPEQQDYLRKHGYRLWDMVGGMSPTEQAVLQELDYYKWIGNVRPLLPGRQQTILNQIELAWDEVRKYNESLLADKVVLQKDFLAGRITTEDYNDNLIAVYAKQQEYVDAKMEEYPLMDLDNRAEYYKEYNVPQPVLHPMRELLNLYFDIELEDKIDEETGEKIKDWDKFWAMRDAIEQSVPDEYKREWEDYLARNSTALEQLRRDHNKYIKPYNGVWERILEEYTPEEQSAIKEHQYLTETAAGLERRAEIGEMIRGTTGRKLISNFRSDVSEARQALRYANPWLDAVLYYWGRVTTFQTPKAMESYQQLARDTGKTI